MSIGRKDRRPIAICYLGNALKAIYWMVGSYAPNKIEDVLGTMQSNIMQKREEKLDQLISLSHETNFKEEVLLSTT
jgi:hypothetical protein